MEMPFILGFLILLIIFIVITRMYLTIANDIGEQIRTFFKDLWERNKKNV